MNLGTLGFPSCPYDNELPPFSSLVLWSILSHPGMVVIC